MEFNAQTAGVRPGGLNNTEQIKLLICHILHNFKDLDEDILIEAIYDGELANSFEVYRALAVLKEKDMITENVIDGKKILNNTLEGTKIFEELMHMLPRSVRENSLVFVEDVKCRKKRMGETSFRLEEVGDEYYMYCTITDKKVDLLTIKLLVPSKDAANLIRENIINGNPAFIYKSIISLLGNDVEGFLEYFDNPKIANWTKKDIKN